MVSWLWPLGIALSDGLVGNVIVVASGKLLQAGCN